MAIDYTSGNGIFDLLGMLVKHSNRLGTDLTNLIADRLEIVNKFEAADMPDAAESAVQSIDALSSSHREARGALASAAELVLTDHTAVIAELAVQTNSFRDVLDELHRQMIVDGEDVKATVVTVGSQTGVASPTGNPTIFVSKLLDGSSAPSALASAHQSYSGVDSELATPETVHVECITDVGGGATSGAEAYQIFGEVSRNEGDWDVYDEGSGPGPQLSPANASSTVLSNTAFEEFTSNSPNSWDVDNGTAGTHILAETGTVYRGSKALAFTGDGAQATIGISQTCATNLTARKKYVVAVAINATATPVAGNLEIKFAGTGYTAGSSEKISILAASIPTSWTIYSFEAVMPDVIPADMELVIEVTGTLSNGVSIYIDNLGAVAPVWHAGLSYALLSGSTDPVKGDRWSFVISSVEGVFQKFFRKAFAHQLPSDAAPSILDSLAQ